LRVAIAGKPRRASSTDRQARRQSFDAQFDVSKTKRLDAAGTNV
jgi:hypothetical protein